MTCIFYIFSKELWEFPEYRYYTLIQDKTANSYINNTIILREAMTFSVSFFLSVICVMLKKTKHTDSCQLMTELGYDWLVISQFSHKLN